MVTLENCSGDTWNVGLPLLQIQRYHSKIKCRLLLDDLRVFTTSGTFLLLPLSVNNENIELVNITNTKYKEN